MAQKSQHGNAVFMILVAVALFAALGFVFSNSSRTSTTFLTDEEAKAYANQIIAYGNDLRQAVKRLELRGCSDIEMGFGNDVYRSHGGTIAQPAGHNPNAPTDGKCDVFKPQGGGIRPLIYPDGATVEWSGIGAGNSERGSSRIRRAGVAGVGDADKEEIILTGAYIRDEVCLQMNEILGVVNPGGNVPEATNSLLSLYSGLFTDDNTRFIEDDDGVFAGQKAFCTRHPTTNAHDNFNVHVLLTR